MNNRIRLSDEIEARERSLASVKRARQKEMKNSSKEEAQENSKPVKRDINIPKSKLRQNLNA